MNRTLPIGLAPEAFHNRAKLLCKLRSNWAELQNRKKLYAKEPAESLLEELAIRHASSATASAITFSKQCCRPECKRPAEAICTDCGVMRWCGKQTKENADLCCTKENYHKYHRASCNYIRRSNTPENHHILWRTHLPQLKKNIEDPPRISRVIYVSIKDDDTHENIRNDFAHRPGDVELGLSPDWHLYAYNSRLRTAQPELAPLSFLGHGYASALILAMMYQTRFMLHPDDLQWLLLEKMRSNFRHLFDIEHLFPRLESEYETLSGVSSRLHAAERAHLEVRKSQSGRLQLTCTQEELLRESFLLKCIAEHELPARVLLEWKNAGKSESELAFLHKATFYAASRAVSVTSEENQKLLGELRKQQEKEKREREEEEEKKQTDAKKKGIRERQKAAREKAASTAPVSWFDPSYAREHAKLTVLPAAVHMAPLEPASGELLEHVLPDWLISGLVVPSRAHWWDLAYVCNFAMDLLAKIVSKRDRIHREDLKHAVAMHTIFMQRLVPMLAFVSSDHEKWTSSAFVEEFCSPGEARYGPEKVCQVVGIEGAVQHFLPGRCGDVDNVVDVNTVLFHEYEFDWVDGGEKKEMCLRVGFVGAWFDPKHMLIRPRRESVVLVREK